MQRHEGDFLRGLRQVIQIMIMQRNAPGLDTFAHGMARQQFPRWAQQHGAFPFRHTIQSVEDHHSGGPRPDEPRRRWPKMACMGREGTSRRGINRFQGAAWRQTLRAARISGAVAAARPVPRASSASAAAMNGFRPGPSRRHRRNAQAPKRRASARAAHILRSFPGSSLRRDECRGSGGIGYR